jgi:hypothetical protein
MDHITYSDFYWDKSFFGKVDDPKKDWRQRLKEKEADGEERVKKAVTILSTLTKEQLEAVKLYGRSCFEDGYSSGYNEGESDVR